MSVRSAVQLAQAILAGAGADIEQDGLLGNETIGAFEKASPAVKAQVRESVRRYESLDWDELVASWRASEASKKSKTKKSAPAAAKRPVTQVSRAVDLGPALAGSTGSGWEGKTVKSIPSQPVRAVGFISRVDAHALANRFTREADLPGGTLGFMLDIEAEKLPGGYDASYRGGSNNRYLGLYQFFELATHAWADGTRHAIKFGFKVAVMHPDGWKDPVHNTACAAGYAIMNRDHLRRAGLPVTKETLYACHQQGAGTFLKSIKAKQRVVAGKQSGDGVRAMARAYDIVYA